MKLNQLLEDLTKIASQYGNLEVHVNSSRHTHMTPEVEHYMVWRMSAKSKPTAIYLLPAGETTNNLCGAVVPLQRKQIVTETWEIGK